MPSRSSTVNPIVPSRSGKPEARFRLEVSHQVAEDLELERQQLHGQWKRRLEQAGYETALARTLCR